jgi:GH15 family glucan-1,4-alpha-glucosidase
VRDSSYPAISDYGLLSDCHGTALVSRSGSVDWCCMPRFDARPVFARLLDWEKGGYFRLSPAEECQVERRYVGDTNVLETTFRSGSGTLVLTDFMVIGADEDADPVELESGARVQDRLIRIVEVTEGRVELEVEYHPRFDFGQTCPFTTEVEEGLLTTYGAADALLFQTPVAMELDGHGATGSHEMEEGDRLAFVVTYELPHKLRPERVGEETIERTLESTVAYWSEWAGRCEYQGPHRDVVVRSALVLKALTSLPTGAIVAAPTTSLPEDIGGVRNWDYRYTWLRDAAHVLDSLFDLGYTAEAESFMAWLHRTTAELPQQLQILYGVGGERLLPEVEMTGLEGYRGSTPVRVGNDAARQFQMDIYGDILHVAWGFHRHEGAIDDDLWTVLRRIVDYVCEVWERPDHGIWEVRMDPQHFVHSKVMAWVAVDRGIRLAEDLGLECDLGRWEGAREAIRAQVLEKGVGEDGRLWRSYTDASPDAAILMAPLMGFLPHDDERVAATREWLIEALEEDLLLFRYRGDDGLEGTEGAFLPCTFWLVQHLASLGDLDGATRRFDRLVELTNDLGLISEEAEPGSGLLLGNFPQALTHIGLINAAVSLQRASPD